MYVRYLIIEISESTAPLNRVYYCELSKWSGNRGGTLFLLEAHQKLFLQALIPALVTRVTQIGCPSRS